MRFAICIIYKDDVITSNTTDGICKHCWNLIEKGEPKTFKAYMNIDTTLEVFPRPKGRFVI